VGEKAYPKKWNYKNRYVFFPFSANSIGGIEAQKHSITLITKKKSADALISAPIIYTFEK